MPRNGSGTYTLPEAQFVPNTTISSADVNSDLSDMADALTASLARDGQGGMTAVLPLSADGFSYSVDPDTGMSRTGTNTQAITAGGTNIITVSPTAATVNGDLNVTGVITKSGNPIIPVGAVFAFAGASAPTGFLICDGSSLLRASFTALFALIGTAYGAADGSHFNVPDLRGRAPTGKDGGTGRLTSATMTPDGDTLGAVGGAQTQTLSLAQLPSGITSANAAQGISVTNTGTNPYRGTSAINSQTTFGGGAQGLFASVSDVSNSAMTSTGSNSISVTSNNTGAGAHINVQPTIVLNYIICTGV